MNSFSTMLPLFLLELDQVVSNQHDTYETVITAATVAVVPTVATATPTYTSLGIGKVVVLFSGISVVFL